MMLPDMRELVPHAGPMVLLDRVVSVGDDMLCAEVVITPQTLFCDGQGVGAWVGIEYMAQAVAAFAGYEARQRGEAVQVGFLLGSRRYECTCSAFAVGSSLHVYALRTLQGENGLGAFECHIEDAAKAGTALATATITVFQPDNVNEFLQGMSNEGAG
ncbi:MAG TPA: hotdog family protein [Oxalicibacterium sp.]|jgi:predicted hotdog family 3-hydroxylacyl-ACP dehydratase|nr:hotdog family protein [Oxalicibacterium sp.]